MKGKLREKISWTLDKKLIDAVRIHAQAHKRSMVSVVEEGIKLVIATERKETAIEGTFRSVSRIEGRVKGLRVDLEAMTDLLCFYTYHWFCHTPAIPKSIKEEAISGGRARYSKFIELLQERRRSGESLAMIYLENKLED